MTRFGAYKTETIITCGIGGAIIASLNIVPSQFRPIWIIGSILIFGSILLSRLFLKITIDEQGMNIRNWVFIKISIPWSNIREIQFRRIPGINHPRLYLEVEHQGKLRRFQLPRHVSRYRELVQTTLDHTGLPPTPALQRFMNLATHTEKRSLRITFPILHFIAFIGFIWWYRYAFHESIANYWILAFVTGYIAILLIQLTLLRYRNPDKASFLAVNNIIVIIIGFIVFIGILMTIDGPYLIAISLLLGVTIMLLYVSGIGNVSFRKGFGFIGIAILISGMFFFGARWEFQKTRTIKEIATISGSPTSMYFAADNTRIGVVTYWFDYLNQERWDRKTNLYSISLPQYKITSTEINQDYSFPCWSPDGKKVFIQSELVSTTYRELRLWNAEDNTFVLVDSETSKQGIRLTFYPNSNAHWSPDSRSFIYLHPVPREQRKFQKLYRYDTLQKKNEVLYNTKEYLKNIYWLDNTTIQIISYDDITTTDSETEIYTLWEYNVPLKKKKILYTFPENWEVIAMSPNNQYLVLDKPATEPHQDGKYYLFNLLSFQQVELPFAKKSYPKFYFHPNRNRILALDAADTKSTVYEFDWKTKKNKTIISEPGNIWGVSYSPTGNRIAYILEKDKRDCLYLISDNGTNRKKLASLNRFGSLFGGTNTAFVWSSDGNQMVVNISLFPFHNQTILGLVTLK